MKVHSHVERGGHVERIIRQNVHPESKLSTDTARYFAGRGFPVAEHGLVNHDAGEWERGEFHTNTLKRGIKGIYQHCAEKHVHRYLAELDFRYNHRVGLGIGDVERTNRALAGIAGKRLTYRDS